MQDIFDIKFPIETKIKEDVITKFSNKQGGAFNIFSQYWQPFVWAATIGFLRNEPQPLAPGTERIFNLNIMIGNGGEKDAYALICLAIARAGSLDIMKDPEDVIRLISEYANGGFYYIKSLIENGENSFNDMEKVKQEIFSRPVKGKNVGGSSIKHKIDEYIASQEETKVEQINDEVPEASVPIDERRERRWSTTDQNELRTYFKQGLSIEQLAKFLSHSEKSVEEQLVKLGLK